VYLDPDMTDEVMIRIYARENATQRGQIGTAQAGSVAAAVQYLAKDMLMRDDTSSGFPEDAPSDPEAKKHLLGELGIGEPLVTKFLHGGSKMRRRR
jgi:hypothetical protein